MQKGKIIFLNGVSSSGKTTLAATLREKLPEPYFIMGNDLWGFFFTDLIAPKELQELKETDFKELEYQSLSMMIKVIRLLSDEGNNVVVDSVLLTVQKNDLLREFVKALHDYPVLFVHVTCPVEELRRREKERGDRRIGQGEEQLATLYPQDTYDITVDTFRESKEDCADRIIALLDSPEEHTAFKLLWVRHCGNETGSILKPAKTSSG